MLWLQNSHAAPIPAGAIALDRMGAERPVTLDQRGRTVRHRRGRCRRRCCRTCAGRRRSRCAPGRHVVRPRYEVIRAGRARIAHVNVERADLRPDPAIPHLPSSLGRGFLLPFPVLRPGALPQHRAADADGGDAGDAADAARCVRPGGRQVAERFLGCLPRDHDVALDLDAFRRPTAATPSWSMISATAARRTAGCTRCSATRTARPATRRNPASARTSSTP